MHNAIHDIRRFAVGSGMGRFKTTALVNGDIHKYGSGLHHFQHLPRNQMRCFIAGDKYRTYHQIHGRQFHFNIVKRGIECFYILGQYLAEIAQTRQVDIRNHHFRTHSRSHLCGIGTDYATT